MCRACTTAPPTRVGVKTPSGVWVIEGEPYPPKPAPPTVPADLQAAFTQLEREATAKGLTIEPTWVHDGRVGYFVRDQYRRENPEIAGPMFGWSLEVLGELVREYDDGKGDQGTGGSPQGSKGQAVEPREVSDGQRPSGPSGQGLTATPPPASGAVRG